MRVEFNLGATYPGGCQVHGGRLPRAMSAAAEQEWVKSFIDETVDGRRAIREADVRQHVSVRRAA